VARTVWPVSGELLILGKSVIRHTQVGDKINKLYDPVAYGGGQTSSLGPLLLLGLTEIAARFVRKNGANW